MAKNDVVGAFKADWLHAAGPEDAVVISSRVRLARNLAEAPFPIHAKPDELKMILESVFAAAQAAPAFRGGQFLRLAEHPPLVRRILKERHLISHNLAEAPGDRGVVVDAEGTTPVMVNEEDHLRLAALKPGLQLQQAWKRADAVDDALGATLAWAYHARWGYLTACPTNCGTGLRASARLHLPALGLTGQLPPLLQSLPRLGLVVRGFHGEGTKALGDIFQISNATTLGASEEDTVRRVENVVRRLVRHEEDARATLLTSARRGATEDLVHRAVGVLQTARRMNYEEALQLLSRARLGVRLGLKLPVTIALLNELGVRVQPAHLQLEAGREFEGEERDAFRADILRRALAVNPSTTPPA